MERWVHRGGDDEEESVDSRVLFCCTGVESSSMSGGPGDGCCSCSRWKSVNTACNDDASSSPSPSSGRRVCVVRDDGQAFPGVLCKPCKRNQQPTGKTTGLWVASVTRTRGFAAAPPPQAAVEANQRPNATAVPPRVPRRMGPSPWMYGCTKVRMRTMYNETNGWLACR